MKYASPWTTSHNNNILIRTFIRAGRDLRWEAVLPEFRSVRENVVKRPYTYQPHCHREYELIIVVRGLYAAVVNGCRLRLKPGEFLLVKPGDWHEDFCRPPLIYYGISFLLASAAAMSVLFARDVTAHLQTGRMDKRRVMAVIRGLSQESQKPDFVSANIQDAVLLDIFWQLIRCLPRQGLSPCFLRQSGEQTFVVRLHGLFRQYLSRRLRVPVMAANFAMSTSAFAHRCRRVLGQSPAQALLAFRMDQARFLLRHSALLVKEIAFRVGFEDPFQFSKAFKRLYRRPPSACRDNSISGPAALSRRKPVKHG